MAEQQQERIPAEAGQPDPADLHRGLARIRQRRWILWAVIFAYVPGLFVVMEMGWPGEVLSKLFWVWVGLLCVAVGLATVVRCPRCGKQFHTNGPTFLPLRSCLHCGLHLRADKGAA